MNVLKMPATVWQELRAYHLQNRQERLSFLFGRLVRHAGRTTVLIPQQQPWLFADDCYQRQHGAGVTLLPEVHWGVLEAFLNSGCDVLINVHDHWFSRAGTRFSATDNHDDKAQDLFLRQTLPKLAEARGLKAPPITNCSLVLDQKGLAARITDTRQPEVFEAVDLLLLLDEQLSGVYTNNTRLSAETPAEEHVRQRDVITPAAQRLLGDLRIGLIGVGGLGSILAEGLARSGVRKLLLVDDDQLEASNLNRWQGGCRHQQGQAKTEACRRNLHRMFGRDLEVKTRRQGLLNGRTQKALGECDILIGAVDNDVARYTMNRVAARYMQPLLDAGVLINLAEQVDFQQRVALVVPGVTSCLECSSFTLLDHEAVNHGLADEATLSALRKQGYIAEVPQQHAASVYAQNMSAAATLLTELINLLCGHRPLSQLTVDAWQDGSRQRADRANFNEGPAEDCTTCSLHYASGHAGTPVLQRRSDERLLEFDAAACFAE